MKEEINLLPPPLAHWRLRTLYLQRLGEMLRYFDLVVAIIILLMIAVYVSLLSRNHLTPQSPLPQLAAQQKPVLEVIQSQIQRQPIWMPRVINILNQLPASVHIKSLSVSADSNILVIKGMSGERADIVALENQLRALPWVAQVESPLNNFATGVDAGFIFKVTPK